MARSGTSKAIRDVLTRTRRVLVGSARLLAESTLPLVRTLLAGFALCLILMVPAWIWLNAGIELIGLESLVDLTTGEIVKAVLVVAVPCFLVLAAGALATVGGMVLVVDDVRQGRAPRAVRSVGVGLRSVPRLAGAVVPAVVGLLVLFVAAPEIVLLGLLLVPVGFVGRRVAPDRRWPSRRTIITMLVPFGVLAVFAARWSVLPAVVMLERTGPRASLARSKALTATRTIDVAVALVALTLVITLAIAGIDALTSGGHTVQDLAVTVVQAAMVIALVGLTVWLFGEQGGVSVRPPDPAPPRVQVAILVAFAVVATQAPMFIGARAAEAAAPGSTLAVDDLGDADDANPGDGQCASSAGTCTLRAAVTEANTSTDAIIGFDISGTITLASPIVVARPMEIDGAGAEVTVSGNDTTRVFSVVMEVLDGGYGAIRNLTIADGGGSGGGGAAWVSGTTRGFELENVTVRGTSTPSGADGGAVVNLSNLTVVNSTFVDNTAAADVDGSDFANVFSGEATIVHSTVVGAAGGQSAVASTGTSLVVTNSIVSGTSLACFGDSSGAITGANNITSDSSPMCPGIGSPDLDALALQPLADNGGPTETVRLGPTSIAIDAGDDASCLPADQRGVLRTKGATCDAGAYEFDPSTTTTLGVTPDPSSAFGATVTLDALVVAAEPEVPRGSVEFRDGTTLLGMGDVNGAGFATLDVTTLAPGSHSITAVYVPVGGFDDSTSAAVAHTVTAATTTVTVTAPSGSSLGGAPVTFTITVVGGGTTPTGTVTLFDGATPIDSPTLDGTGSATVTTSTLSGGHHVLTAHYSGDGGHGAADSAPLGHDIVAQSSTSVTGPGATVFGNAASFAVTVTPTGGGATPTGAVTLQAGSTTVGPVTLNGSGQAAITTSALPTGVQSVTVTYSGDSYNSTSTSAPISHTVNAAATSTALTVSPSGSSVFGNTVSLQATVTAPSTTAKPAGTVTFLDGSTVIGSGALDVATGTVTYPLSSLAAGNHSLRVDFTPDMGFVASSSSTVGHTVLAATTAVGLTATSESSVYGETVNLTATVSSTDSPRTPTGSVTFYDGATLLDTVPVDGTGKATLSTAAIAVGSRTLTAQYGGASGFATSTSSGLAHTVTVAQVTVTLTDTPDPTVVGEAVTFGVHVVAVAPGSGIPTGTVLLKEGSTTLATLTLDGAGRATTDLTSLPVGVHTIVADYAGSANHAGNTGSTSHTISADTATVALTSSAPTSTFTQSVTFTATVSGTGSITPTGTVVFQDGATVLGSSTLVGGVATLTVPNLRVGNYPVTAEYAGNVIFSAATGTVTQNVVAAGTATTLVVNPMAPTVDDLVTLTATVAGTTTAVKPAGSVTFYDGATALATVALAADGTATHERTFTRAVHSLTARFVGSSGWSNSNSSATSITPARAPVSLGLGVAPTSVTVGGSVTLTATVTLSPIGPAPTGSIDFWSGSTHLGSGTITSGVATLTRSAPIAVGPWAVSATYDGDLNHEQGATPDVTVQVTAAATTTTAAVPPTAYVGDTFVVGAQVASPFSSSAIAGQVRFTSNAPGFSTLTANVDSSGFAQATSSPIAAGSWTVTATFEPSISSVFATSSSTQSITGQRRSTSLTLSAPSTANVGSTFFVDFSVTDISGTGPSRTGTVTVSGGGTSCTGTVSAGQCSLRLTTSGSIPLTAVYSGDTAYDGATSNTVTVHTQGGTPTLRAFTTTSTWATDDPIGIGWQLTGPASGEVVVSTPFGEACRVVTTNFGSCTVTIPFEQRGQSIPIDVSYAGDSSWQPASATVTQTVVGCYPVIFEVIPAGTGTITHTAGNCNGGTGFLAGTNVSASVAPVGPYQLDHWLETGSTARAISFVVGDGSTSAMAFMTVDCVSITVTPGEQIDYGQLWSGGGRADLTAPNCPGRPTVETSPTSPDFVGWYVRDTEVTITATPRDPADDELKG